MKKALLTLKQHFKRAKEEYRKSFTISFGVFAIFIIFSFIFITRFVNSYSHDKETEASLLKKKLEYRYSLMNAQESVEKELENLENNWLSMKSKIFLDSSDDLAFSNVLRIIEGISKKREVTIRSYKLEEVKNVGNFSVLPIRFEFSTRYENLVSLLYEIENYTNYLKISNIEIRRLFNEENLIVKIVVRSLRYYED